MANLYDKSSLVLIPSGTKTGKVYSQKPTNGDGDFTFTRASAATRVNADGNIEKETQNLFTYSNNLSNPIWQLGLITATSGQSGYDGSSDAWLITKDANAYRAIEHDVNNSGVYTYSVYAKANTLDKIYLRDQTLNQGAYFDLTNGTTYGVSGLFSSINSVGGGWYRCSVTFNGSSTRLAIYIDFDNATAGSVYVQDFQVEQGLVARDYIETTTSAVYGGITDNVPRLDYTDSSCPALLLEPLRTNVLSHSEYIAAWQFVGSITRTSNYGVSPEGVQNSTRLQFSGASQEAKLAATSLTGCVASIYIKGTNGETIKFGSTGSEEVFTLNGSWQRLEKYNSGIPTNITINTYSGATARDIEVWGAQVEQGSYATSYIPTYGSSVSRVGETCVKTGVSDLIGQTEGTIAGEFNYDSGEPTNRLFSIAGTDWNSVGSIRFDIISLKPQATIRANGGEPAKIIGTQDINVGSLVKFAVVYTSTTLKMFVNGAQIGSTETLSGSLPSPINQITINALGGGFVSDTQNNQLNPYKQALVFKTALTDQEAIDLTTI